MSSRTWTLILLLCGVATIVIVVGSPFACQLGEMEPYEVRLAKPYIEKIVPDDAQLGELADAIAQDYPDKEGKVNAVYRYIVKNFTYIPDPENGESINSPFETLDTKGGDCEDLTILACSLLENIGIRTYLVLTESHAYGWVSGIDPESLWTYINGSLQEQFIADHDMVSAMDEVLELGARHVYYYGGDGSAFPIEAATFGDSVVKIQSLEINYSVWSSEPVNIYILPSRDEFDNLVDRRSFEHYPDCRELEVYQAEGTCEIPRYGGIAIQNPTSRDAVVNAGVTFSYEVYFEGLKVTYYTLEGQQAIVLELTAGKYGYPGYSPLVETERKLAIDPITGDYFSLE
jgi:hypothetical protein